MCILNVRFLVLVSLICLIAVQLTSADDIDPDVEVELSKIAKCMWKVKKQFPKLKINLTTDWYLLIFKPGKKVVRAVKCFAKCFLQKSGLYNNETQEFNMHIIKEKLGDAVPSDFLDDCQAKGLRKTNECGKAFTPFACILDNEKVRKSLAVTIYGKKLAPLIEKASSKAKEFILNVFHKIAGK